MAVPTGAPTDVSVRLLNSDYVLVNWQWSSSNNFSLHIILCQADLIVESEVVGFEESGMVFGPLSLNTEYKVVVEAISVVGDRLPSRPVHFTTDTLATYPVSLEGTVYGLSIVYGDGCNSGFFDRY